MCHPIILCCARTVGKRGIAMARGKFDLLVGRTPGHVNEYVLYELIDLPQREARKTLIEMYGPLDDWEMNQYLDIVYRLKIEMELETHMLENNDSEKKRIRVAMQRWYTLPHGVQKYLLNRYTTQHDDNWTAEGWIDFLHREFGTELERPFSGQNP